MSTCNTIFQLDEINIIGGDYKEFPIKIHDNDRGGLMDVTDLKLNFSLVDYGKRYESPIITKDCEVSSDDEKAFILVLHPDDTKNLAGKYVYQLSVKAPNEKEESFQGILNVNKNINPDAFAEELEPTNPSA